MIMMDTTPFFIATFIALWVVVAVILRLGVFR
jgi:hypothetical protein